MFENEKLKDLKFLGCKYGINTFEKGFNKMNREQTIETLQKYFDTDENGLITEKDFLKQKYKEWMDGFNKKFNKQFDKLDPELKNMMSKNF